MQQDCFSAFSGGTNSSINSLVQGLAIGCHYGPHPCTLWQSVDVVKGPDRKRQTTGPWGHLLHYCELLLITRAAMG